jgi:phospho-N-acetylmuramoyl-pentapeptide-transferase
MINDSIVALLISFTCTAVCCPLLIPVLYKFKFGQQVRDDGPQAHLKKSGTPTMGGIMILLGIIAGSLFYINKYTLVLPVLLFTVAYGVIGFLDDFLKIKKRKSEGLKSLHKFILQIILTALFVYYLHVQKTADTMLIPFTGSLSTGYMLHTGIFFIPLVFFIVLGTDNGVNFTDGVDGLCTCVTIIVSIFFGVIAIRENIMISPVIGAVIGSLTGFLIYNTNPAKVFMGDTGSLALGGFVASTALVMQLPLFIAIVGFIYLIEVVSVIIQVGYFKATKGKRFFKMAPIHHHFELSGWSETKVVTIFSIVTAILSLLLYLGFNR